MMANTGWPSVMPAKTNSRLSGAQSPAELMNCRLSKYGFAAVSTILRVILPVATSATYMSIDVEHRLHGLFDVATGSCRSQHVAHRVVAPGPGDVRPERVAVSVGEEIRVVEPVDTRHLLASGRIANPHRGVGVDRSEREVFGHSFDEPQRKHHHTRTLRVPLRVAPRGHVVLERVHQLVAEDVIGLGQAAREGHDDAPLVHFGHTPSAFSHFARERVGLPKMRVCGVENEWLASAELMAQQLKGGQIGAQYMRCSEARTL